MSALALFALAALAAPEVQTVEVPVDAGDPVVYTFPKAWTVTRSAALPVTLNVRGEGFTVQITSMGLHTPNLETLEQVRDAVKDAGKDFVEESVEKSVKVQTLKSKAARAAYATFTDAKLVKVDVPAPGSFHKLSSGMATLGKTVVAFTVLFNRGRELEHSQALEAIASVRLAR